MHRLGFHPGLIYVADISSLATLLGVLLGILPAVVSLFAAVAYGIQIWESQTFQRWRDGQRHENNSP